MGFSRRELAVGAIAAVCIPRPWARGNGPGGVAVQALLNRYVVEQRYAGAAAAFSYHDRPLTFCSAGSLSFGSGAAIDSDSLFRLYSVTKPVTGIAAMLLVEDGTISLDQPVADVLPELRRMQVALEPATSLRARPATRPMTMRQLITHTSGLSSWQPSVGDTAISKAYRERGLTPGSYGSHNQRSGYGPQVRGLRALIEGVAEIPLVAEPGTAWNYSLGLDVMGAVIERASGQSLDRFMRERIFVPLGMASTGFQVAQSDAARMTSLYGRSGDEVYVVDPGPTSMFLCPPVIAAGGGGLVSSARDLIRFAAMLRDDGTLKDCRVMRPETVRLAFSNLLPPGVHFPATGGFGAGAAIVMPGVASPYGAPGTLSVVGASSTMMTIDPARRGVAVFLAQLNSVGVPPTVATAYRPELHAAIEAELE